MSQRRLGLFMVIGSLLLVTPFMVSFSQGVEKSVFTAMATLADVKETLESKRDFLKEVHKDSRLLDGSQFDQKVELANKHHLYAAEVYKLSQGFLKASSTRHPKYATFWNRYKTSLGGLWTEIEATHTQIQKEPQPKLPAKVNAQVAQAPKPQASQVPTQGLGRGVPMVVASASETSAKNAAPSKGTILERYRDGYQAFARGGKSDLETSRNTFEEILKVQPTFHLARYWLARTYLLQDRVADAEKHATHLLEEQPNLQIAKDLVRDVAAAQKRNVPSKAVVAIQPKPVAVLPPKPVQLAAKVTTPQVKAPAKPVVATRPSTPKKPVAVPVAAPPKAVARIPDAPKPVQTASLPKISTPVLPNGKKVRPIAVMIENSRHSRPQSGLLKADTVFEMPVEGGITRFLALYNDHNRKVEELGPVRSARHYFVHQMKAIDGIYAHCGGSTMGYVALKKEAVDHIDEIKTGWGFWRNKKRKAPHNLYTKLSNVVTSAKNQGFRMATQHSTKVLPVRPQETSVAATEYQDISLPYYSTYKVSYTYDPVSNTYARFINKKPHNDKLEGRQIAVENVVVVKMGMRKIDDYGRLDLDLFGRGEALVYRGGEAVKGTWVRQDKSQQMELFDSKGQPVQMNPGRTWVHMIQPNRKVAMKTRPVPAKVLAQIKARRFQGRRSASLDTQSPKPLKLSKAQGLSQQHLELAKAPALPARSGKGVPAVVGRRSVPSFAPVAPASGKDSGVPGVVLGKAPVAPSRSASLPPTLAGNSFKAALQGDLTPAQVPESIRPLKHRAKASNKTWKNGNDTEYDLADFSLDSF